MATHTRMKTSSRHDVAVMCPSCPWKGRRIYVPMDTLTSHCKGVNREGFGNCPRCATPLVERPDLVAEKRAAEAKAQLARMGMV